jgi:mannobiose 2-epimerase
MLLLTFLSSACAITTRNIRQEIVAHFLSSTLPFWIRYSQDPVHGGYYGLVHSNGTADPTEDKGLILNGRLLWGLSAACRVLRTPETRAMADRAQQYILAHFYDATYQGYYYTLDAKGRPVDDAKHGFGMAFVLYGLAEHHLATGNATSLQKAIELHRNFEDRLADHEFGGYLDAASRNWTLPAVPTKSTNIHLHILEAYVNLYRASPDAALLADIRRILELWTTKIYNTTTWHMKQEVALDWTATRNVVRWGHDFEASWILYESALAADNATLGAQLRRWVPKIVDVQIAEGIQADGSLPYERGPAGLADYRDWWPQIEALNGLFCAHDLTADQRYLGAAARLWAWVRANMLDYADGEWVRTVRADGTQDRAAHKIDLWKSCYHTFRLALRAYQSLHPG